LRERERAGKILMTEEEEERNAQSLVLPQREEHGPFTAYFMFRASFDHIGDVLSYLDDLRENQGFLLFPKTGLTIEKVSPVISGQCSCVVEVTASSRADCVLLAHEVSWRVGGMCGFEVFLEDHELVRRYLEKAEDPSHPFEHADDDPLIQESRKEPASAEEPEQTGQRQEFAAPVLTVQSNSATQTESQQQEANEAESDSGTSNLVAVQIGREEGESPTEVQSIQTEPIQESELSQPKNAIEHSSTREGAEESAMQANEETTASQIESGHVPSESFEVRTKHPFAQFQKTVLLGKINSLEVVIMAGKTSAPINLGTNGGASSTSEWASSNSVLVERRTLTESKVPIVALVQSEGFEILGGSSKTIEVPLEQVDSRLVRFELEAKKEGRQSIRILFQSNGTTLSEIGLAAEVLRLRSETKISRRQIGKRGKKISFLIPSH
jgi:hypothetical protein